jgi:hypothetical protein
MIKNQIFFSSIFLHKLDILCVLAATVVREGAIIIIFFIIFFRNMLVLI